MIAVADRRLLLPPNLAVPMRPWIVLAASAVAASCPADATEDILATISVPAGAMGPNGSLRIWTTWSMTNSANAKSVRYRLSGIGGTAFTNIGFTTVVTYNDVTTITNRNAQNSQVAIGPAGNFRFSSNTSGVTTGVVDTSAATSLVITGQKALNTEALTLEQYLVELLYGA